MLFVEKFEVFLNIFLKWFFYLGEKILFCLIVLAYVVIFFEVCFLIFNETYFNTNFIFTSESDIHLLEPKKNSLYIFFFFIILWYILMLFIYCSSSRAFLIASVLFFLFFYDLFYNYVNLSIVICNSDGWYSLFFNGMVQRHPVISPDCNIAYFNEFFYCWCRDAVTLEHKQYAMYPKDLAKFSDFLKCFMVLLKYVNTYALFLFLAWCTLALLLASLESYPFTENR